MELLVVKKPPKAERGESEEKRRKLLYLWSIDTLSGSLSTLFKQR